MRQDAVQVCGGRGEEGRATGNECMLTPDVFYSQVVVLVEVFEVRYACGACGEGGLQLAKRPNHSSSPGQALAWLV